MTEKIINVDYMSRVEGEGALRIKVEDGHITDVQVNIFEPPRFFEAFLKGRSYNEVVDITARICGICPIAYQMSAAHALEKALGITPPAGVRELRRLMYCGEWIESHALHVYMLHAPDYLGYESAISMAANPDLLPVVQKALRLKRIGNDLVTVIGGREIHPISVCVGGFYRAPDAVDLQALLPDLEWGLQASLETARWAATLEYPPFETDYEFVSLSHPDEYPFNEGVILSSTGLEVSFEDYEKFYIEEHVEHSNALHSHRVDTGTPYLVGPLARFNLNFDKLSPAAKGVAEEIGIQLPVRNPFTSILIRSIEMVHAYEEAINIIKNYKRPVPSRTRVPDKLVPCEGSHATEAPRGMLFHHYKLDENGLITFSRLVPPTAQNLPSMEDDLRHFTPDVLDLPLDQATAKCEQLVRCYDPCISCATHFLKLTIDRS